MPISSYLLPLTGYTALMTVTWWLGHAGYSYGWVILLSGLSVYKLKLWKQREKRLLSLRHTMLREKEVVMAQLTQLPAWVHFPDTERVEWINKVILQAWPYIGEYIKLYMKENIEPTVKATLPSPFKSFRFEQMDMGTIPMRVGGIKVYTENVGKDRIIVDMDVAYAGDCDFMVSVGAFKAGLNQMQFKGQLRCIMKPLLPYPPMVGGISLFFLDVPVIDFNLTGMGEMVELPGLMGAMRSIVNQQVKALAVLPNEIVIPLVPDLDLVHLHFPEPDGVIRIHLVEARNLENKDISNKLFKGKSDPYTVSTVGAQTFKSKVIQDNLDPKWNEFYEAVVDQAQGQHLRMELFDEDKTGQDEELGWVRFDLAEFRKKGYVDEWFPLEGVKHGEVHLKLYWMNFSQDARDLELDQWESEWLEAKGSVHTALLLLYVEEAVNLPLLKSREPSPFILFTVGNQKQETFPKWKTCEPQFQQKFIFFISQPETQSMNIEAFDTNSKKSLGEGRLQLSLLMAERNLEMYKQKFTLKLGSNEATVTITARLRMLKGGGNP